MILTAHQPVYLPWLGLFHKIALSDVFVSFNQVQYLPKDWNNRNKIKTQNEPIWLTVPVIRHGYRDKTISDIEINNDIPWRRKHWKSIYLNYKDTRYFNKYASFLEDTYQQEWNKLTELNEYMLRHFLEFLGIEVNFFDASQFKFQGRKNELVLDMCTQLKADTYIFGALGRDYADAKSFDERGIRLIFQEYKHPFYEQLYGEFVSHLSIIDLLFNCGESSLSVLMEDNITREKLLEGKFV